MVLSLTAASVALGAACSSSGGSGSSAPVPPATGDPISAHSTGLGVILVEQRGRTVYVFANDSANVSRCTGACAADWPPVRAPAPLPASVPGVGGSLGMTTRSDGTHQLTVAGHPLYTFSGDSDPGQTNGQGINLNGGLWSVVLPSGAADTGAKSGP
jgi:predicted lipoprotein with Yx(FWY)xxD motif